MTWSLPASSHSISHHPSFAFNLLSSFQFLSFAVLSLELGSLYLCFPFSIPNCPSSLLKLAASDFSDSVDECDEDRAHLLSLQLYPGSGPGVILCRCSVNISYWCVVDPRTLKG